MIKKAKTAETQPCPECGGPMVYESRPDTFEYGGQAREIQMLAWWCTKCEEGIFEGKPLADREKAYLELKAEVDEVLSPAEVKVAREKLGLSQRKAGEILGGGPRSFQKYEAGTQAVSTPMSHVLRLLSNDPSRLEELTQAKAKAFSKTLTKDKAFSKAKAFSKTLKDKSFSKFERLGRRGRPVVTRPEPPSEIETKHSLRATVPRDRKSSKNTAG